MIDTIWAALQPYGTITAIVAMLNAAAVGAIAMFFDANLKSRFNKLLEDYKFSLKAHEQRVKIAEYAALAISIKETDNEEMYRRVNQLSWEMLLWLPADTYKKLGRGLTSENKKELVEAILDVRKIVMPDGGELGPNDIIVHGARIGQGPRGHRKL